jgi:glycosyltransferase involved in cell wall biosynthesis
VRVVIAKKLLSSVGGSEIVARRLAAALAERGHLVTCIGMRPAWPRPGIPAYVPRSMDGPAIEMEGAVRYVYLPPRFGRLGAAIDGLLPTSLADTEALVELLRGADVVHVIAREWAGSLERAARRVGAAFIETPLAHPGQPFSGAGGHDVGRYRRDDAVIALTEWEAGWYRAHGARSVHVTGLGARMRDVLPAAEPATVLFVGRKERYKGYHALRDAARMVWRERPETQFVAIGQRAWQGRFERWATDERWVELDVVDEATKDAAYSRASVLAMPSEHETFGHTYLEAWAAGRPVIAGDIAPLREVVRSGIDGWHARNEPADVARAVLEALSDPIRAAAMGAAGRDRVSERWTWPIVAERTEAAYAAALGGSRTRS